MPYIKDIYKKEVVDAINDLFVFIESKGDLNYVICELVGKIILENDITYTNISEMIGAVHDAETELRRRLLYPYEDIKMHKNGDVPSFKTIIETITETIEGIRDGDKS